MAEVANYVPNPKSELRGNFLYHPGWNSVVARLGNTRFDVTAPAELANFDFLRDIAQHIIDKAELFYVN